MASREEATLEGLNSLHGSASNLGRIWSLHISALNLPIEAYSFISWSTNCNMLACMELVTACVLVHSRAIRGGILP